MIDELPDVFQEPPINFRHLEDLLDRPATLESEAEIEDALGIRDSELRAQRVVIDIRLVRAIADEPEAFDFE